MILETSFFNLTEKTILSIGILSMDKFTQLSCFINRMVSDSRLKPVHISLSLALCHGWIANQFQRSYRVSRSMLMRDSRIRSPATYHKALNELQMYGYFKYSPSYHPNKASKIEILDEHITGNDEKASKTRYKQRILM